MRKHKGINQKNGRLKKGYKYSGKKLKSGLSQIIKGGGGLNPNAKSFYPKGHLTFDEKVKVVNTDFNDCPPRNRVKQRKLTDEEGVRIKKWGCEKNEQEFKTLRGYPCCKKGRFRVELTKPALTLRKASKSKTPQILSSKERKLKFKNKSIKKYNESMIKAFGEGDKGINVTGNIAMSHRNFLIQKKRERLNQLKKIPFHRKRSPEKSLKKAKKLEHRLNESKEDKKQRKTAKKEKKKVKKEKKKEESKKRKEKKKVKKKQKKELKKELKRMNSLIN